MVIRCSDELHMGSRPSRYLVCDYRAHGEEAGQYGCETFNVQRLQFSAGKGGYSASRNIRRLLDFRLDGTLYRQLRYESHSSKEQQQQEMKITISHARSAGICGRGARRFFALQGWDWTDFLTNGIDEEKLAATGDPFALRAIAIARKEANVE